MDFNLGNSFFLYQSCSGLGRLDFKENLPNSFPIFPEFRRQASSLPLSSFFSGRILTRLKIALPIQSVFRNGFFLVSNELKLGLSFHQLSSLLNTPFLGVAIFPFIPVDLFLSSFFFLFQFRFHKNSFGHFKSTNSSNHCSTV